MVTKEVFRFFIKSTFKTQLGLVEIKNSEIDEIGIDFHKYLDEKLNEHQKKNILPKSLADVFIKHEHPLKTNGFEPAYVLHFVNWCKDKSKI